MRIFAILLTTCSMILSIAGTSAGSDGQRSSNDPPSDTSNRSGEVQQRSQQRLGGFVFVSERLLQMLLRREVKQNQQIVESILKMTTYGTASAECNIGLDLLPNSEMANVRLTMHGSATMGDAVSEMRNIRIHSSSYTNIQGYKDIFFEPKGLRLLPTVANCNTNIEVHDIEARPVVERLAWRRVNQKQSEAEQAAAERAARRAEEQLETEAGAPLEHLNNEYVKHVYQPLTSKSALPDTRVLTTDEHLSIRFYRQSAEAESSSEKIPVPAYDVAVCLNDVFVNEMTARLLSGNTITDEQFANIMLTLVGKTPQQLWVHDRAERWSILTAAEDPLHVTFRDDRISIALRVAEVQRGEERMKTPLVISAKYSLEMTPQDGPHLIRDGEVQVQPIEEPSGALATDVAGELRVFLKRKFSGLFLSDLYFDGLTPPAGGTWGKLRRLHLKQFASHDGWFDLGYQMQSESVATKPTATVTK